MNFSASVSNVNCKLSVCMITYNQEPFVRQAVESVFSQKANFEIELVIGDDASTDGTAAVINSLSPPAGIRVNFIKRDKNLGMLPNFVSTLSQCSGQYIALLEGDDYWIDSNKLQRQVDFLESNPEFSICYHPVNIDRGGVQTSDDSVSLVRDVSDIYDLAKGNFMHTCSVVYRANLFEQFPDKFFSSTVGDYFLHMLNAQYGKIKKVPATMGVYRVHEGGVWSLQPNMDLKILTYLEAMIGIFEPDVEALLVARHKSIAVKSFFSRVSEEGFEKRLQRCCLFGADVFQAELARRFSEGQSHALGTRLRNVLKRFLTKT